MSSKESQDWDPEEFKQCIGVDRITCEKKAEI
jgi:hypothetical protein